MDEVELNRIVEAWITGHEVAIGTPSYESNWWAINLIIKWSLDDDAAGLLWRFILATYKRDISDRVVAVLAAGPLEDLLARHGALYIDRVEQLARDDEKFNCLLGGVWRSGMQKEVWRRVKVVRKEVW